MNEQHPTYKLYHYAKGVNQITAKKVCKWVFGPHLIKYNLNHDEKHHEAIIKRTIDDDTITNEEIKEFHDYWGIYVIPIDK